MSNRRPLVAGIKVTPEASRALEEQFIQAARPKPAEPPPGQDSATVRVVKKISRVPFTTRVRADLAEAVKRASLQRQLQGIEPNQVQEILEEALEPWLRSNGYLT